MKEDLIIGEQIIEAYIDIQNLMKKTPEINECFKKYGADRNLIAALTEAIIIEIQKRVNVGAYGVLKEGIECGFEAVSCMTDEEIAKSLKNDYRENLKNAIWKRM